MGKALFLNGVFEDVVEEILENQRKYQGEPFYLQPYSKDKIKLLENVKPTVESPLLVYISVSNDLKNIAYFADIVKWENKRELDNERLKYINERIGILQPSEKEVYEYANNVKCINLISIMNVRKLSPRISVSNLIKISDNKSLSMKRSRSGRWSYVYEIDLNDYTDDMFFLTMESVQDDFERKIIQSQEDKRENRLKRLNEKSKKPQIINIISTSYVRNADVVVEVLYRADGICERCHKKAPFIRAKDNTPYLEVHHCRPIKEGGEDSVDNAMALCPNCHRELHFGIII